MFVKNNFKQLLEKTVKNIIIIVFLAIIIGYVLNTIFLFNQESLYWLTSSIIQAFGALVAIFISIGFYFLNRIQEAYKMDVDALKEMLTTAEGLKEDKAQKILDMFSDLYESMKEHHQRKLDETRNNVFEATITIIILIISSLIIISLIGGILRVEMPSMIDNNIVLSVFFVYFILLSIFSLYILLKTMMEVYDIQYKYKSKNNLSKHD